VVVQRLIGLASDPQASAGVRSRVEEELRAIAGRLVRHGSDPVEESAHLAFLSGEIGRFLDRRGPPEPTRRPEPLAPPPGQPIGMPDPGFLDGLEEGCSWEP
jgi:hypothetical protein